MIIYIIKAWMIKNSYIFEQKQGSFKKKDFDYWQD